MPVVTDFYELFPIVSVLIGELCLLTCRHGCLITNISFSHRKINRFDIAGSPRAAQFYQDLAQDSIYNRFGLIGECQFTFLLCNIE